MAVPPEKRKSPRQCTGPMTRSRRDRLWWTEPTRGQVRLVPAPRVDVAGTLWCLRCRCARAGGARTAGKASLALCVRASLEEIHS